MNVVGGLATIAWKEDGKLVRSSMAEGRCWACTKFLRILCVTLPFSLYTSFCLRACVIARYV